MNSEVIKELLFLLFYGIIGIRRRVLPMGGIEDNPYFHIDVGR